MPEEKPEEKKEINEEKIVETPKEKVKEKSEEKKEDDKKEVKENAEKNEDGKKGEETGKRQEAKPLATSPTSSQSKENGKVILGWEPKTKLGREVKDGRIKNIDEILNNERKILEAEIVDFLMNVKSELINIGQSKGKFGGGKRRIWRQTQRKTKEGNIPTFSTLAIIGDEDGHIGISSGKSKETLPAREKAIRKAKLNIFKVKRACSGFDCSCSEPHSIPFKITGKTGSIRLTLIPAAQGTGLVVGSELKKVLKLAGIKDVYSRVTGKKRTTFNLVKACIDALKQTKQIK